MFKIKTKVQGFYKLDAVKIINGKEFKRPLTGWFPNLITDSGLDALAADRNYLYKIAVGTGSTAPTVSDIALETQIASTTTGVSETNTVNSTSPYYISYIRTKRFAEGVAAGNLSEVGVIDYSSALFSRSLILDSVGNPTTITILSDEYLDVTYEFRYYPYESDVTGTIVFTGNIGGTYGYTLRQANITRLVAQGGSSTAYYPPYMGTIYTAAYSAGNTCQAYTGGVLGDISGYPTGTSLGNLPTGLSLSTYVAGSNELYFTIQADPADWVDVGGISALLFTWGFRDYQIAFTTAIPKTADDVLALTFIHQWARV